MLGELVFEDDSLLKFEDTMRLYFLIERLFRERMEQTDFVLASLERIQVLRKSGINRKYRELASRLKTKEENVKKQILNQICRLVSLDPEVYNYSIEVHGN